MNWTALKAFHKIYTERQVKVIKSLSSDPYFQTFLSQGSGEIAHIKNYYYPVDGFDQSYERHHLQNFQVYEVFMHKYGLDNKRFEEDDIKKLIEIEADYLNDTLFPSRATLVETQETVRGFSHAFFKTEKYLNGKDSLVEAINDILDIQLVDNKDQQYIHKLECAKPKLIVLCENINFLRQDIMPRRERFELWYAGGRNIKKLDYADTRGLKIYYSCDWDKDGLEIYELAKDKIANLQLLSPTAQPKSIIETEHKSLWKERNNLDLISGLTYNHYSKSQISLIQTLMLKNQWIVEESNNLLKMIQNATQKD